MGRGMMLSACVLVALAGSVQGHEPRASGCLKAMPAVLHQVELRKETEQRIKMVAERCNASHSILTGASRCDEAQASAQAFSFIPSSDR